MASLSIKDEAFNAKQVRELAGITKKQVVYWDSKGLVKPSIRPAAGRGSQRLYSYVDLLALRTVKGLRDQGVSLQKIRKCVSYLRKHLPDISKPLSFCRLVTDGNTVILVQDEETLIDTVKNRGQMILINIASFDHELRSRVIQFSAKRVQEAIVGDYAYQVEIEPAVEEGGYVATVAGLAGCITDGDTLEEVLENAKDAIKSWLEAREDLKRRGVHVPLKRPRRKKASA